MKFKLLYFLLVSQIIFGQNPSAWIDSLAIATTPAEKSRLSLEVASDMATIDWERARYYIDIAKENAIEANSPKVLADFYKTLGNIYSNKDALDIALENFLKAYRYYESKPSSQKFKLENNLAIVYARTGNPETALSYFKKVYQYQQSMEDTIILASILNNMGRIWLDKNVDSSLVYFKKSLLLAEKLNNSDLKLFLYTNLGKCYMLKEDFGAAKKYFNLAEREISPTTVAGNIAWVYNEFAKYYISQKIADSAIFYSKKSVTILDSFAPYSFEQLRAVKILYQSYLDDSQYRNAAPYFEKYATIIDSINLEDKKVNVEKLLIAEEYRSLEKIRKLEESKRQSRNYIILLILVSIVLFLGILLLRFRNKLKHTELEKQLARAKQNELNINLELKNKELIGKAMIEMHRTEIIEDILKDLKEVKLKAVKKETQTAIDFIAKRLKRDTSANIWEEFELRFEQVHESFYKNILEKHPDLSPREKRLAALLKLNLTSKEIAQITGQSPKSVENARTRLRKKLDITNMQTDLSAYLSTFG